MKKLSVALEVAVAEGAASAAERHGVSLSAWFRIFRKLQSQSVMIVLSKRHHLI